MQSILQNKQALNFPDVTRALGPLSHIRQLRIIMLYAALYALAALSVIIAPHSTATAFGHSLAFPASGFLAGWNLESGVLQLNVILCLASLGLLGAAGFLWFATGNVILPPLAYVAIAAASAFWQTSKPAAEFDPLVTGLAFSLVPIAIAGLYAYRAMLLQVGRKRRARLNKALNAATAQVTPPPSPVKDELSLSDLQHMRLLLDRALQPVDEFEGFEWLDQFQTAAVRYQINFISYALSIAQADYMPDFTGYLSQAQQNLKAKQENHRIWKYWQLENLWGNLRKGADPIARDNIMFSGFVGAQLSFARQADPRNAAKLDGLNCQGGGAAFTYTQNEMIQVLVDQYKEASYGLLSCEPNWVYPLCNAITASAIRAHDTQQSTDYWAEIADGFERALETEFMTPAGRLVPFKSNYTGFAPPQVGGAVMQGFPCVFLNCVLPEIAQRQWASLKLDMQDKDMGGKSWRRALWPADVGNYSFSRASSYAATAFAAREMGDDATAELLLALLDEDCPMQIHNGIAHHSKASLWANANAFMARIGRANSLR